jgi:hypothetical protein
MATTPNYGWVMPDPTDFVTNLPADFEVFGDAVDATVDGIETTANAAQPNVITTEGDLVVGDASGDPVRLPIGAVDTFLKSDGDTAEWATIPAANYTLLTSGSFPAAAVLNITGLSASNYMIVIDEMQHDNASSRIFQLRFNNDSTSVYRSSAGTTNATQLNLNGGASTGINFRFVHFVNNADLNSTLKNITGNIIGTCTYKSTSAITELNFFFNGAANFNQGTYQIWGQ